MRPFKALWSLCLGIVCFHSALAAPSLPLHTQGRSIVDAEGQHFKLKSVNWYGSHLERQVPEGLDKQSLAHIISLIQTWGFNSVRLPFSNAMLRDPKPVDPKWLTSNPELQGRNALEVFDATVRALTDAGIYVILNNHSTYSQWCCSYDANGLWHHSGQGVPFALSVDDWEQDWLALVKRYQHNPLVIGVDLRNEVRTQKLGATILPVSPNWGSEDANDWHKAAESLGRKVLDLNPELLIIVEGINWWGTLPILGSGERPQLKPVRSLPIRLQRPDKLIYAAHHYGYIGPRNNGDAKTSGSNPNYCSLDEATYLRTIEDDWAFILQTEQYVTAPLWISEFGVGWGEQDECQRRWFARFAKVLLEKDIDFAYWPLNPDSFGLVQDDWSQIRNDDWRTPILESLLKTPPRPTQAEALFRQLSMDHGDDNQSSRKDDWLAGARKATCPDGLRMLGLSRDLHGLCSDIGGRLESDTKIPSTVVAVDEQEQRPHTGQDWAKDFTKYECPLGTYVKGFSKHSWGLSGVLCAPSLKPLGQECYTLWFDRGDQRRSQKGGDWAKASYKGQCADLEYVAGLAQRDGRAAALLCCSSP